MAKRTVLCTPHTRTGQTMAGLLAEIVLTAGRRCLAVRPDEPKSARRQFERLGALRHPPHAPRPNRMVGWKPSAVYEGQLSLFYPDSPGAAM